MDLDYCSEKSLVDLDKLILSTDITFNHDFIGILNNFNRTTKELEHFVPRSI